MKRARQYIGILPAAAVMYYITIALLLLDPLYLSILCGFFGGCDMNGISLLSAIWVTGTGGDGNLLCGAERKQKACGSGCGEEVEAAMKAISEVSYDRLLYLRNIQWQKDCCRHSWNIFTTLCVTINEFIDS